MPTAFHTLCMNFPLCHKTITRLILTYCLKLSNFQLSNYSQLVSNIIKHSVNVADGPPGVSLSVFHPGSSRRVHSVDTTRRRTYSCNNQNNIWHKLGRFNVLQKANKACRGMFSSHRRHFPQASVSLLATRSSAKFLTTMKIIISQQTE